ncbi:hypothetical protein BASA62_001509 [Batrachochytrium salamandrivorans]|nr:hypothetical protein BASA62_001509 [Batrachochytrium salamandrivorans]
MRFVSLVLLSFIATNTGAIYIPKVHPVHVRDFRLSKGGRSNRPSFLTEDNSNEPSSCQPNPTGANEQSGPSQRTPFTSRVLGRVTGSLTNIRDLCGRRREHNNAVSVENDQVKISIPDLFLREKGITRRIKLLKKAVKKAMKEQKAKCQDKTSQTTSDKATTDRSSNSDLDEFENDLEELIEIAQEASPSSQRTQTYQDHMFELRSIRLLVDEVVKGITGIKKDKYTLEHKVNQKAAIQRSIGYLKELTDISDHMAKAWCIVPKKSTFKNGDGLLELLLKVDEFKEITDDALKCGSQRNRKGRKGLVTSKEILDEKKKTFHRITIPEEEEDEEEEQDAKDGKEEEQDDQEEDDDKYYDCNDCSDDYDEKEEEDDDHYYDCNNDYDEGEEEEEKEKQDDKDRAIYEQFDKE